MKSITILLCFCLSSCTLMKLTSAEEIIFKSNQMKLTLDEKLSVDVKIDDTAEKFLFDTGASGTIVFDTTLIKNFSKKEKITLFNVEDPNGQVATFYTPANVETEMYNFNNNLVTVLKGMKNPCTNNYFYKGIIGSAFFKKNSAQNYLFDFDNLILKSSEERFTEKDYSEIKSKFFDNHIAIYLSINGYEEPFLFDTGNLAYPLIIGSDSKIKPSNYIEYVGSEGIVASGNLESNSKYSNENELFLAELKMSAPICFVSSKMGKYNNMGLDFIKYFNWIVDYKNKKVFFKRNNIPMEEQNIIPEYNYLCMIVDNQLKIITKLKSETKYSVNDQIIAVNNQKVTPQNICEMQSLLNETNDWNTLQIEILKN